MRDKLQVQSIYFFRPLSVKDAFVFYYKDYRDEDAILGEIFPFNISKHPIVEKMYISGEDPDDFERISVKNYLNNGKTVDLVYDYMLLKADGKNSVILTVSFFASDLEQAIFDEVMNILILNVLCFVSLGIIVLIVVSLQFLRPLAKIQKNVRDYTSNKDSAIIVSSLAKIKSRNEIGRLVDDISSLTVELEHYTNETAELSAEKAKIASELSLAASIQNDALPKNFPDDKKFKLFALLKPAQDVGGDLYDFFMLDDDHIALVIGDVSGKGISAALFMMKVKSELKASALRGSRSPKEIITSLNEKLCEENDAMMFVTLWFGIITISTGEIVYVNAGHEYPIIKADGLFEINKSRHTPPLAAMPKVKLNEEKINLKPGDTFLIYTDGVPEANNIDGEQFGLDKTLEALNENPDSDPEELANTLLLRINEFAGDAPQFDDTTILCVKYFG